MFEKELKEEKSNECQICKPCNFVESTSSFIIISIKQISLSLNSFLDLNSFSWNYISCMILDMSSVRSQSIKLNEENPNSNVYANSLATA